MSITISAGSETTAPESDFTGTVNPRAMRVPVELAESVDRELSRAMRGSAWEAQRLGRLLGGSMRLSEAFSTSDFKFALFKELDTEMQAQYQELPAVWQAYTDQTLVSDFRPRRLLSRSSDLLGLAAVPEGTEYPDGHDYSQTGYAITVAKYGRRRALTWEAWLNNEAINEIEDIPADLARQAREMESIIAASNLLAISGDGIKKPYSATGVNTGFFKAANGNAPTALPLTADNLKTVLDAMAIKKDSKGKTLVAPPLVVVTGMALKAQADAIKAVREVRRTDGDVETVEGNPLAGVEFVHDPYLDQLNTHAKAATTWFVLPKPGSARPAAWAAKLRGHESPDLRVKANQGTNTSGGAIAFDEGSFEVDTIEWRTRHVLGAQTGAPEFTYCSLGS